MRKVEAESAKRRQPKKPRGPHRVVKRATVREKSTSDSKKLGWLEVGERVEVAKSRQREGVAHLLCCPCSCSCSCSYAAPADACVSAAAVIRCKISLPPSLLPADSSGGGSSGFGWVSLAAKDGSTLLVPEHQWCALLVPFPSLRVASGSGF